jgi:hypothetical protein
MVSPKSSCLGNLVPKFICWWYLEVIRVKGGREGGALMTGLVALQQQEERLAS